MMTKTGWITRKLKNPKEGEKMVTRGMTRVRVVSVSDIPLTKAERRIQNIIRSVYALAKGRGLRVLYTGRYTDVEGMQKTVISFGRLLGKPVTTRVRYHGKEPYLYIFKRTDLTKRRGGMETR